MTTNACVKHEGSEIRTGSESVLDTVTTTTETVGDDESVLSSPQTYAVSLNKSLSNIITASSPAVSVSDSAHVEHSSRKRRTQIADMDKTPSHLKGDISCGLSECHDFKRSCTNLITPAGRQRPSVSASCPKKTRKHFPALRTVSANANEVTAIRESEQRGKVRIPPTSPRSPSHSKNFDPVALKEYIVRQSSKTLKKLPHRKGSNPIAEFIEYLPNEKAAINLFNGIEPSSHTSRHITWTLTSNESVNSWLEKKDQYIHPVEAGEWFINWGAVYNPLYAWAKFHSCEATYEKNSDRLTIVFKSELFATGRHENGMPCFIE